jgi:hypothetical protein
VEQDLEDFQPNEDCSFSSEIFVKDEYGQVLKQLWHFKL